MVEELVLEPSEESLALRTIVAAALRGHTSDQAILITNCYPLRPAVAPAAVRVDRRRTGLPPVRPLPREPGWRMPCSDACQSNMSRACRRIS